MEQNQLMIYGIEGGLVHLPFFDLPARPAEVAALLQSSLAKINRGYRVSLDSAEDESGEKKPVIKISLKSKDEKEWRVRMTDGGVTHTTRKIPYTQARDHIISLNEIYAIWAQTARLENEALDWAGMKLDIVLSYKQKIAPQLLSGNLVHPEANLEELALADMESPVLNQFDLDLNWKKPTDSNEPTNVERIRFVGQEDRLVISFDLRHSVNSMADIEDLHTKCIDVFGGLMFTRFVRPLSEHPQFKEDETSMVIRNE